MSDLNQQRIDDRLRDAARLIDTTPNFNRDLPPYQWEIDRALDLLESIAASLLLIASHATATAVPDYPSPTQEV